MLSEKIIRLALSVVTSALIARYLGPQGFGELNYYIALLSIAIVLSSVGFNRIIVRDVVQSRDNVEEQNVIIQLPYIYVCYFLPLLLLQFFTPFLFQ